MTPYEIGLSMAGGAAVVAFCRSTYCLALAAHWAWTHPRTKLDPLTGMYGPQSLSVVDRLKNVGEAFSQWCVAIQTSVLVLCIIALLALLEVHP
jgi:hypothetical protein